jgi:hypothetical protein
MRQKLSDFARKLKRLKPGEVLFALRVRGGFVELPRRFLPKRERKGQR